MALLVEYKHRSARVRVTAGTTMFQVLETACGQLDLATDTSSIGSYALLHRGRAVDLSLPFRLTGISNNAKVELQERQPSSSAQQVRVAVQNHDGKRFQGSFTADQTLEVILQHFQLLPTLQDFSLSFMRREIRSEAFHNTSLQDLGVLSGSAMFRVQISSGSSSVRQVSEESPDSRVTAPAMVSAAVEKPATEPASEPREAKVTTSTQAPIEATRCETTDIEMTDVSKEVDSTPREMSAKESLQALRDSCFDAVSRVAVVTLMKIMTNILSNPDNDKMKSIRLANAAFERNVGRHRGGIEFLVASGFELNPATGTLQLRNSVDGVRNDLLEGVRLLNAEADDLGIDPKERPEVISRPPPDENFDVFKPQITRMQMQPRGPSSTEVLVEDLKAKQESLLSTIKPARNTRVFLDFKRGAAGTTDQLQVTGNEQQSDAQLLIASMKSRRAEIEKAQDFQTRAMRELEDLKRRKVFQNTILRIQFPDRVVLQAAFHPNESVEDVIEFTRACLDGPSRDRRFYLYSTPPMQKLKPESTLQDFNLVPAAHIYLSWLDTPTSAMPATAGSYLLPDLLCDDKASGKDEDPEKVNYPQPIPLVADTSSKAPIAATASQSMDKPSLNETKERTGKKPAWLKL